ncbi:hypothetical protein E5162_05905 [Marinicauda pacifica]|uniref:Uncharacterized protein n=1 Tax=Marinicauda pacifica TaxID=1133559 RepID=A0A4S2HGF4_9PROT|nr:hypothetical protein E5162_05905 [Marinicauda pacifica]
MRNWLANEARGRSDGAGRILDAYDDFQEWNYERQCAAGFSEDDILDYPTSELLTAMFDWTKAGRPASY